MTRLSIHRVVEAFRPIGQAYALREPGSALASSRGDPDGIDPAVAVRCGMVLRQAVDTWQFRINRPREAPVIVGFFGGTGTGKSTLLNAIAGREICHTSPIRPNTAGPVLYVYREFLRTLGKVPQYLGLPCVPAESIGQPPYRGQRGAILLAQHNDERFRSVALLDCPDIDSFDEQNRAVAARLLEYLDAMLLVSIYEKITQREYAEVLRQIGRLALFNLLVVNKVDSTECELIRTEATSYLADRGWKELPVFVDRMPLGLLSSSEAVAALRDLLVDPVLGPRRIEDDPGRRGNGLKAGLIEPARAFLDAATQERDHADRLIVELRGLLPEPHYDIGRFTSEFARDLRKQSWLYHFSLRQVWDHVEFVRQRLQATVGRKALVPTGARKEADETKNTADLAGEYLMTQVHGDLEALHLALEDRAMADPLACRILRGPGRPETRLNPERLQEALREAVEEIRQLMQSAQSPDAKGASKVLKNVARRLGLPVQHVTKLVPYLVIADLVLVGGAMTLIQGVGMAILYEVGNLGLAVLTDEVRRETRRIAHRFHARYRECLSEQIELFVRNLEAGLASRGQLEGLAQAIESLDRRLASGEEEQ